MLWLVGIFIAVLSLSLSLSLLSLSLSHQPCHHLSPHPQSKPTTMYMVEMVQVWVSGGAAGRQWLGSCRWYVWTVRHYRPQCTHACVSSVVERKQEICVKNE